MIRKYGTTMAGAVATLLVLGALVWFIQSDVGSETSKSTNVVASEISADTSANIEVRLPTETDFVLAGESAHLKLWADQSTGHFKVEQKESGYIWRSYPDPAYWGTETSTGLWYSNLLSPIMIEYVDATNSKSQAKLTNLMEEKGVIEQYEWIPNGFRGVYHFVNSGFKIPFEVVLGEDFVETKVIDSGIEEGTYSLLNLKLYSQFGAKPSINEDGYILIPDGPGALIKFDQNKNQDKSIYRESVYGSDLSFYNEVTNRQAVSMPVFGIKSGEQSFVAVLTEGEEYAKVFAAPANALGQSNWATGEWQYRIKFFQSTDRASKQGFFTYSNERFEAPSRTTRYYLLSGEQNDYADMATTYRNYLIETYDLHKQENVSDNIPFYADLVGADLQEGLLWDDYITGTTTDEAIKIVDKLYESGIQNVHGIYNGWQRWGYSSYGGLFPIDQRLGGNEGMQKFTAHTKALGGKVLLAANYALYSSNRGNFWSLNDGLRNMAGTLLKYEANNGDEIPYVSPRYAFNEVTDDLVDYTSIGVDGVMFTGGIGNAPYTDFNTKNKSSRAEVIMGQQDTLASVTSELGHSAVDEAAFYSLASVNHIHRLADDYSYDIFVDETIPFAQMALHGLVTYTSEWGNMRNEYHSEFLRSVEYGAYPAFIFSAAPSGAFKKAYSIWHYSLNEDAWIDSAAEQYKRMNEALKDVQDQFIVHHETLSDGVKLTEYENGKSIIVNYNANSYTYRNIIVPGQDFVVVKEGN